MGDVIWCRPRNGNDKNAYSWLRGKVSGDAVHMDDGRVLLLQAIEMDMDICRGNLLSSLDLDDLGMLTHLNEPSMVHCLEERFMADKVYCNTGDMLLAVNPFKMIPHLYDVETYQQLQSMTKKLPHVFTTANDTYQALHAIHPTTMQHQNQTVLVSGESGSGKTESTKFIMQYLAVVSKSDEPNNIADQVLQSNPILESFGNARTLRNDNSSRFGKFVKIWFAPEKHNQLRLIGTTIETYLLEKVRLVHQAQGERNFHIFYELLAEAKNNKLLRESLHLHAPATAFTYLKDGGCYLRQDNVRDIDEFQKTMRAMDIVGFQENEKASILEVVASMLHLGNMKFGLKPGGSSGGSDTSISDVSTLQELEWVSELLAVDKERLRNALTKRQIKAKDEWYVVHLTMEQAEEARDAMARSIYGYLFDWIVCKVNLCIGGREFQSTDRFIGVLDIFGFESFELNSFEQLCINYANERLQHHFIDFVLTQEQKRYQDEGIPWETLTVPQNEGCLEILENRPTGLLALLDEECNIPKGSDAGLVRKLYQLYNNHPQFNASRRDQVEFAFIITHYAGAVRYEAKGFCDKNRDKPHQEIFDLLSSSNNTFVSLLCRPVDVLSENIHVLPPMMRRKSSLISLGLGSQFRRQLHQLLEMIALTQPHYIRCLKPNDANKKHQFHRQRMADQLRYGGVLEAVRIARLGYSVHMKHAKFIERYALLSPIVHHKVETLLKSLTTLLSSQWPCRNDEGSSQWYRYGMEIGKTLVFLRQASYDFLEKEVGLKMTKCAIIVQAFARMALYRHRYHVTKTIAVESQRIIRGFLARRAAWRLRSLRFLVISVQAWFRGYKQRQAWHLFKQHLYCTAIQSQWRRYSAQRKYSWTLQCVIRIQCHWRCKAARRMLYQLKSEALSLKHTIQERNELRQKLAATQNEATIALQRAEQAELELKKLKALMEKMMEDTPIPQTKRMNDTGGILKSVDDIEIPYNTSRTKAADSTISQLEKTVVSSSIVDTSIAVKSLIDTMPLVVSNPPVSSGINLDIQHKNQVKETLNTTLNTLMQEDYAEPVKTTPAHTEATRQERAHSVHNQETFCPVQEAPSQVDKKHHAISTMSRAPMHESEGTDSLPSMKSNSTAIVDDTHSDHGKTDKVVLDVLDSVIEIAISANVPVVRREFPFQVGHSHALPTSSLSSMDMTLVSDSMYATGGSFNSSIATDSNSSSHFPPLPISTVDLVHREHDQVKPTSMENVSASARLVPPPADSDIPIVLPRASPTSVLTRNASYLTWANLTLDDVRRSIEQGHNPDNQDSSGRTMLHFAVETSNAELVDLLLSLNANPMITDFTNQETPFHVAAKLANMEISGIFCRPDILPQIDTNLPDKEGNTVLHLAAMSPRPSAAYVLELYLCMGADPNAQNVLGRTPLHICALHRRDSILVDRLVAFGADPNIYAIDHKTPLHIAVKRGLLEQSIELVKGGGSLTLPDGNKWCCMASELSKALLPFIKHPPYMIPDQDVDACMLCQYPFNFIVRRHHCRRCGIVGCSDCVHKQRRREDASLPVLKREQIMGMLHELNQRQAARGYQSNNTLARAEEKEKAQSISHFLSIRYHDIYGEHLDGSVNNAPEAKPPSVVGSRKGRIRRSQSISQINHPSASRRPSMGSSVSCAQLAPLVQPEVKEVVQTPVDRQLPPLYHKIKAIWKQPLTGKPSEEELLGLAIAEHTVRNVLSIDVYEAHGIAKAFAVGTVETLYQLYTKERIHGREGHMREQMQKAVFSSATCNRVMNILKQIDAFSIFLDSRQEESEPVTQTITITEGKKSVPKQRSRTPEPTLSTPTDCNGRHLSIATASLLFLPPVPPAAKNRNDMINVYLEGCAQHHVFPSKKVIALLDTKTINLSHFHLGKLGTMAMLSALEFNHSLESLDVSNNFLTEAGGTQLCLLLERNPCPNLSHLSLAKNHIGTSMAARLLHALARSNSPLKSLNLSANEIYDRSIAEPLKILLSTRSTLTSLDLSDNKLRDSSARTIATILSQDCKLRMLNLGWNSITPNAASEMIRAVASNKTLESLNLSWNRLGHATGCAVAIALLRNQTLRDLDLSSGQLSAQSVFLIADALHYNHGLSHFRLDQNYITDDGMKVLLRATKRRSKLLPLQLSLQNMIYETNDSEHVRYDPLNPSGFYELDFTKAADRCIYELLRLRLGQGMGTFNNIQVNNTPIESMRRLERSVANGQTLVQFHYVAVQKQTRSELVHFRLDLSQPHDRTMVQFLMLRANAEQGENWYNETLDGVPFQFDESTRGTEWLALHPKGLLEFDYASTKLFCERHYRLDLSVSTDRAVVWKLLERLQRSHQMQDQVNSQPDELKNITLDGDDIALSDLEYSASMTSQTKWKWRVPSFGILEFDFYTPKPHQIHAKHYVLDLSNASDRHTAHELRVRSFKSVGECWWNERIDGYPFHLSENCDAAFEFPRKGILELDFLVLRPAHYVTSMSMDDLAFDLSQFDAFFKAELLRRLTIAEPHDYLWTNVEINKKVYVRHDEMLPAQGKLTCSAIIFHGLAEPASAENFNFFLEQLNQSRDDPDHQKYIVRMACRNAEEMTDEQDSLFFTSSMVDTVLMQIEAEKHQQQVFELLYPNIIDKAHAMDLAIHYKSQAVMTFLGIESFDEFQAMCIKTYLHTRFNPRNI